MKKLFVGVVGFSFCLYLIFCSVEFFLRAIPNDYNLKQTQLHQHRKDVQVLILGSSHTYVGINPELLTEKAYNLAYSSQTLDIDDQLLSQTIDQFPQLKKVILSLSYFSYPLVLEDGNSANKIKNYNLYWGIYSHTYQLKNHFELLHQPWKFNKPRLKNFFLNPTKELHLNRYGFNAKRAPLKKQTLENSARHAVANHTLDMDKTNVQILIQENINHLEHLVELCEARNINVYFISAPTTRAYYERLNSIQLSHWRQTTLQLLKKYPSIKWMNRLDDANGYDLNDFQDADHLNLKGAEKFSREVNEFLLEK